MYVGACARQPRTLCSVSVARGARRYSKRYRELKADATRLVEEVRVSVLYVARGGLMGSPLWKVRLLKQAERPAAPSSADARKARAGGRRVAEQQAVCNRDHSAGIRAVGGCCEAAR